MINTRWSRACYLHTSRSTLPRTVTQGGFRTERPARPGPLINWLSRRSVLAAIHTGTLIVELVPFSSLVHELYPHSPTNTPIFISCAFCGAAIVRAQLHETPQIYPLASFTRSRNNSCLTNGNL
ncbi:hypothetical protein BDR03DRAFT_658541 [Suillus americanus]|nr:hypothetical protein BDR03DRAFT_658541 [Suillus americanus]